MGELSFNTIRIDGAVNFNIILYINMEAKVNDHASLLIMGTVKEEKEENIIGKTIYLKCLNEEVDITIFWGFITQKTVRYEGIVRYIELKCVSGSYVFDQKISSCSFQDINKTYGEILKKISGKDRNILFNKRQNKKLSGPLIQYKETDWSFIKRLASHLMTIVVPDIYSGYPQVSVGIVNGKSNVFNDDIQYTLVKDLGEYRRKRFIGNYPEFKFMYYKVKSNQNFNLGDNILFQNDSWVVMEKNILLAKGAMDISYLLGKEEQFALIPIYNYKITGMFLNGTVLWTSGQKLGLHLDIDKEQKASSAFPYDYLPITGNIMYAMPEVGSKATLYLPNENEANALVVGSTWDSRAVYKKTSEKRIDMPNEKRLIIDEESMRIENDIHRKVINLVDELGIKILSGDKISIHAVDSIALNADVISSNADLGFYMENVKSHEYIDISGTDVLIHVNKSISSGLPHKVKNMHRRIEPMACVDDVEKYTNYVLGSISQSYIPQPSASVLGAIPVLSNVLNPYILSESIKVTTMK